MAKSEWPIPDVDTLRAAFCSIDRLVLLFLAWAWNVALQRQTSATPNWSSKEFKRTWASGPPTSGRGQCGSTNMRFGILSCLLPPLRIQASEWSSEKKVFVSFAVFRWWRESNP